MIGEKIAQYRIAAPLGRGSTAIVYKAVDETLGRDVAVKVLHEPSADPARTARFRAEAAAAARLNHPAIAAVYELLEDRGRMLMVMELVTGRTLEQTCRPSERFSVGDATYFVDQILSALEHAHRAGVVHCDIKPANVMVTIDGAVKIMDFGTARIRGDSTDAGGIMGTPAYMAPEQILGHAVDARVDLYATGVLLYRLLSGTVPFVGDTTLDVARKQLNEPHAPLRTHGAVPDWCDELIDRALAKVPEHRFRTASLFRDALRAAAGWHPSPRASAGSNDPAHAAPSRFQSHPALAPVGAALLAASVGVAVSLHAINSVNTASIEPPAPPRVMMPDPLAPVSAPPASGASVPDGRARNRAASARAPVDTQASIEPRRRPEAASIFEARVLEGDGRRAALRDCELVLGNDAIDIRDAQQHELRVIPYTGVASIDYSHGPDPAPQPPGTPTAISRVTGGFLRLFSGRRHWLTLQTSRPRESPVVLQFGREEDATRAIAALEARTGRRAVTQERLAQKLSPMSPD